MLADDGVHISDADAAAALGENPAEPAPEERPTRDPKPRARPGKRKPRAKEPSGAEKARRRAAREAGASSPPPPKTAIRELERGLAATLTMPALPAALLPLPADTQLFMLQHFTTAGPATAKQLAQAAEQSPELRELLERANRGSATLTLVMAGAIYLAPVALWAMGKREAAVVGSQLASADPEQLAANAEAMEAMFTERMMRANANGTEQPGTQSPEHEGPAGAEAPAEPPPLG